MSIPESWRSLLIEHMDAPVPIRRVGVAQSRQMAMEALISRGWIREGHPTSLRVRPENSYITQSGRFALARALGDWANNLASLERRLADRLVEKLVETSE